MARRSCFAVALVVGTALGFSGFAASASGAEGDGAKRVLVIPFVTLNVPQDKQWIGTGVRETLVADMGRPSAYMPMAYSGQVIVEDNATAVRLAKEASADYAVRGAVQVVNDDIRLTAQLIEAKTGDTLATGIVTGSQKDLLKLEDDLAAQLRVVMPKAAGTGGGQAAGGVKAQGTTRMPAYAAAGGSYVSPAPVANTVYASGAMDQSYGAPAYVYSPVYLPAYSSPPYTESYVVYPLFYGGYGSGCYGHGGGFGCAGGGLQVRFGCGSGGSFSSHHR